MLLKRNDARRKNRGLTICIIAAQRAGTTALQWAIKAAGVANFGEIFHTHPLADARGSFLNFATEQRIPLVALKTRKEAAELAARYYDWLQDQSEGKDLLLDIKLNSWSVLAPWRGYTQREPVFLSLLKRKGAAFVFIWRDDLAEQVLSEFVANELGVWHNLTPGKVAGRTVEAPLARLRSKADMIVRAETEMLENLADYPRKIVLQYEELFREGGLSSEFRAGFREMTDIDLPQGHYPRIKPNSVPKREIVVNYDEVAAAIAPLAEGRRARRR